MIERDPNLPKYRWHNLGTSALTATVAVFSGRIGDQPGDLPFDRLHYHITQAFPVIVEGQEALKEKLVDKDMALRFQRSPQTLGNMIAIQGLERLGRLRVGNMVDRMAELAGGEEASHAMASHIFRVHNTRERGEAVPLLKILSGLVIANSMELPSRQSTGS